MADGGGSFSRLDAWQQFIVDYGAGADAYYLSAVTGIPEKQIIRLRERLCGGLGTPKRHGFTELFSLWSGKPPSDADWPLPRQHKNGHYEWQEREELQMAALAGTVSIPELANILTRRLQDLTGDCRAVRTLESVRNKFHEIGLQERDIPGAISLHEAGDEIGSYHVVHDVVTNRELPSFRSGRYLMIPREAWTRWKAKFCPPPPGFVRLSSIREALGIRSDAKLPEYAKNGYLQTAILCHRNRGNGFWYIAQDEADRLTRDRRLGRPMPWYGKPSLCNQKATWKKFQERRHPDECQECARIWGKDGAPTTFEDFARRYHPLVQGAKRHLTRPWSQGLTIAEVSRRSGRNVRQIKSAIRNGTLITRDCDGAITSTQASLWISHKCPLGIREQSWMDFECACREYAFRRSELETLIRRGRVTEKRGQYGAQKGQRLVSKAQCANARGEIGYSPAAASRKLGLSRAQLFRYLEGLNWRTDQTIDRDTLLAVRKRMKRTYAIPLDEAAKQVGRSLSWIRGKARDGIIHPYQLPGDKRRHYLTQAMVHDLKRLASETKRAVHYRDAWFRLKYAAEHAGVSTTLITRWGCQGSVATRMRRSIRLYNRRDVERMARQVWGRNPGRRRSPPTWLIAEQSRSSP